jgi:hypothetical protein
VDQDQTAIQQIPTSAGHPPLQVVWAPWIRRAVTAWRGVARSFAQMGEAFGMRRSGIIACHVSFLASDADGLLAMEVEEPKFADWGRGACVHGDARRPDLSVSASAVPRSIAPLAAASLARSVRPCIQHAHK